MPRQFSFRGDRLAYSWGIVLLAAIAFLLLWVFGGDTHSLIPLYSVGVFVCFTLSQVGMVRHWLSARDGGWRWRMTVNGVGRAADRRRPRAIVVYEKFWDGAWLVVILVPMLVGDHAVHPPPVHLSRRELAVRPELVFQAPHREERVVVPIPGVTRAVVQAINVARSIDDDVRAVYITAIPNRRSQVRGGLRASDPGRAAGRGRVAVPGPGRAAPRLSRRPGCGVAAGPGTAHHLRRHPRVRRPPLVGADPLQPGRQAAALGPARPARARSSSTSRTGARIRRCSMRTIDGRREPELTRTRATARGPARWYRDGPCRTAISPQYKRVVVALNGGPAMRGSSDSRPMTTASSKAELIAIHVVEIDWTLPLDADIAGRSEDVQRVLDMAEEVAESVEAAARAGPAPGP